MGVRRKVAVVLSGTILACNGKPERTMPGKASTDVRVGSELSCPSCAIVIDTVTSLTHIFASSSSGAIARNAVTGAFYVVDRTDGLLKAFDQDGQFTRTIGRIGGGPGEYEQVRNVLVGRDGAIHILDGALGRHTVFTPDGKLLSTARVDLRTGFMCPAVLQVDGEIVVNSLQAEGASGLANTVERIDTSGRIVASVDPAPLDRRDQWRRFRLIWQRSNGDLFVARRYAPVIEVYSPDLVKKGSITRVADWFPEGEPEEEPSDGVFDKPISPSLVGIWQDEQGRLWLSMLMPSPDWTPRQRLTHFTSEAYRELAARPRIQTIIEVLDVERQHVVARSRFDGGLGLALGGGFIADYMTEDAMGEPAVRILRVSLKE